MNQQNNPPFRAGRVVGISGSTATRNVVLEIEAEFDPASTHIGDTVVFALPKENR